MSAPRRRPAAAPAPAEVPAAPAAPEVPAAPAPAPTLCGCGCAAPTVRPEAGFIAGHDARLAGQIGRALAAGEIAPEEAARRLGSDRLMAKAAGVADTARRREAGKAARAAAKAAAAAAYAAAMADLA